MFHTAVHKNVNVVEKKNQTIFGFGSNTHFGGPIRIFTAGLRFPTFCIFRKPSANTVMIMFTFCGVVQIVGTCFDREFIKDPIQVSAHESDW